MRWHTAKRQEYWRRWRRWYAWRPVRIGSRLDVPHAWVWLEWVERFQNNGFNKYRNVKEAS